MITFNPSLADIEQLLKDGRIFSLRLIGGRYIASALPLAFDGGPVPEDWRAEGDTAADAIGVLLATWDKTPNDFQWAE